MLVVLEVISSLVLLGEVDLAARLSSEAYELHLVCEQHGSACERNFAELLDGHRLELDIVRAENNLRAI